MDRAILFVAVFIAATLCKDADGFVHAPVVVVPFRSVVRLLAESSEKGNRAERGQPYDRQVGNWLVLKGYNSGMPRELFRPDHKELG